MPQLASPRMSLHPHLIGQSSPRLSPNFSGETWLQLLMGGRKNMMCIQEEEGIDVGHFGNQLPHCPSLEYQVHTSPSLASLVHHRIPSTYCCVWHMVSVKIFIAKVMGIQCKGKVFLYETISSDQNTSFSLPCWLTPSPFQNSVYVLFPLWLQAGSFSPPGFLGPLLMSHCCVGHFLVFFWEDLKGQKSYLHHTFEWFPVSGM